MRDYDEVTNTVLRRRDEQIIVHKKRVAFVRKSAAAVMSLCLIAGIGLKLWNGRPGIEIKPADNVVTSDVTAAEKTEQTTADTGKTDGKTKTPTTGSAKTPGVVTTVIYSETTAAGIGTTSAAAGIGNGRNGRTGAVTTTSAHTSRTVTASVTTTSKAGGFIGDGAKLPYPQDLAHRVLSRDNVPTGKYYVDFPKKQLSDNEKQILSSMESGIIPVDVNMDGKFDIKDCMDIIGYEYGYKTDPDVAENIMRNYDLNNDGMVYEPEGDYLLKYYIVNYLSYRDLLPETYADIEKVMGRGEYVDKRSLDVTYQNLLPNDFNNYDRTHGVNARLTDEEYMADKKLSEIVIGKLKTDAHNLKAFYNVFLGATHDPAFDMDVNRDGKIDIKDWYFQYTCEFTHDYCYYLDDEISEDLPLDTIMNNCLRNYDAWEKLTGSNDIADYLAWYFFEISDDSDNNIYSEKSLNKICRTDRNKYISCLITQKHTEISNSASDVAINSYHYLKSVKRGLARVEDSNGDGAIDIYDSLNADIYYRKIYAGYAADDSIRLPDSVETFFREKCDLNNNGASGDMQDLIIYELAVCEFADDPDTVNDQRNNHYTEIYEDYVEKLRRA